MHTIKWVGQEDVSGCGIAALAMLLGKSYQEVKDLFPNINLSARGLHVDDVLADFGLASAVKHMYGQLRDGNGEQMKRDPWPPEPFAEVHLCNVRVYETSPCSHWVIMLADGSVLDPLTPDVRRLTDYHAVNKVAAIAPLPPRKTRS